MADGTSTNYVLGESHVRRLAAVVRRVEGLPVNILRGQPRRPFMPGAQGQTVYQCVYGTSLASGTRRYPGDSSKSEPVAVCAPLGKLTEDIDQLTGRQVYQLQQLVISAGVPNNPDGRLNRKTFDALKNDPRIATLSGNSVLSLSLLRTRFLQGYCATGQIVFGTEFDLLAGIGNQVFEGKLKEALNGQSTAQAEITVNQAAVDAGTVDNTQRIFDRVVIRDFLSISGLQLQVDSQLLCEFNQQQWFADDTAYTTRHWQLHSTYGYLPVFDLVATAYGNILIGKTGGSSLTKGTSGSITIYRAGTKGAETASGETVTAYNRFATVAASKWVALANINGGWELIAAEC